VLNPQSSKDRYGAPGVVPADDSPVGAIPVAPPLFEEEQRASQKARFSKRVVTDSERVCLWVADDQWPSRAISMIFAASQSARVTKFKALDGAPRRRIIRNEGETECLRVVENRAAILP
jgi:hypothetical protein